jgi:hypothetical protein
MTGQINVNKIAARGGNTITINSGDALDVTLVKGEGNATTNLKQGLVKQWCHLDLNTENSVDDSFNTSSIADAATGKVTVTRTTNFASINYCMASSAWSGGNNYERSCSNHAAKTTALQLVAVAINSNGTLADCQDVELMYTGDLA